MDKVSFTVNGQSYTLSGSEVGPGTSLNDYLRNYLQLHGTKAMCHEGGCGACVVSVSLVHPATKEKHVIAVNSCLVHILSCHEWDITTVEGIGNRRDGYHAVQKRLAAFNGSQCGYCSSGWVMNMYCLSKSATKKLTTQKVEDSFGGNLCRCTGYRSILDAFKSFANDTDVTGTEEKLQDLEDLHISNCARKCGRKYSDFEDDWCVLDSRQGSLMQLSLNVGRWYKAFTIQDVFKVMSRESSKNCRLVAGNTGKGVYPITRDAKVLIDISSIESLKDSRSDENLVLGAGMTLTELMDTCRNYSGNSQDFMYLNVFYKHLDLVAHVPVRNIGTIGGNLALKNQHHEFPSDLFLLFETVGGIVTLVNSTLSKLELKLHDFVNLDMLNKLIINVKLPPLSKNNLIKTYKIMPRAQNAHAIVNAGFHFYLDSNKAIKSCRIVLGNIASNFNRAYRTEAAIVGLQINDDMLKKALASLVQEIMPVDSPPEPSAECRKNLTLGLFYKAVLSLAEKVNPRYKSGGTLLERGVSQGKQTYETDKTLWPLNKPVPKLEALAQCAGEAKYVCDVHTGPQAVHVAFVLSTVCRGNILRIDATDALKVPGVVGFFSAKDIPGKNSFMSTDVPWIGEDEEIFASKAVLYYGQPVGVIAAVTRRVAESAAELVKVHYEKSREKLVLNIREALMAPDKKRRVRQDATVTATSKGTDVQQVITGTFTVPSQYHYTMETQSCTTIVTENGLVVRSATQWMDLVHVAVAKSLGIDENRVLVEVPRVGGGYGGKASRAALPACVSALVAKLTDRTATLVMPLTHNMQAIGMRHRADVDYEVGVNKDGVIQYMNAKYYSESGCSFNDSPAADIASIMPNVYSSDTWNIEGYSVLTDKPSATWCRAPGTTEAIGFAEHIMERISHATGKDHIETRLLNLSPEHDGIKDMVISFKADIDYDNRKAEIQKYNSENAWKKRAIKMSFMCFPIEYSWNFCVSISVYHADGTVDVSHGGVEMGQGINTKVAQVCAYTLKIGLEKVNVRGSNSFVSANCMASNGSITSDSVAYATVKACEDLLKRMDAVKNEFDEITWEEMVKRAFQKGISLQSSYMMSPQDGLQGYSVYGLCCADVELDVLTGTHVVRRLDLLEDTGISMSPEIDVGQIEGAFVMGLGLWTTEHLVYDNRTGRLLTDRTWTYKPPGAKDIPEDFRIAFRNNSPNPTGVLRSKATGEPALTLAVVVTHALHDAMQEARNEFGHQQDEWVSVGAPYTVENILKAISPNPAYYILT